MNENLKAYSDDITNAIQERLTPIKQHWLDKDVVIPVGSFKGRKGKCTYVSCHQNIRGQFRVCMLFQPYRIARKGMENVITSDLLWDPVDARKYWCVDNFEQELELWYE